jgi:hypothetical protein
MLLEFYMAGGRAMFESITTAHKLAEHYPDRQEVFVALMHSMKTELDDHVVEMLNEVLSIVKRFQK